MSQPTKSPATTSQSASPATKDALATDDGTISVADTVVQKVAGIACREITGVHAMGKGGSRTFGAIKERIPGSSGPNIAQGVGVEVGETEAAIDLDIVVEYGVAIAELGRSIQRNVKQSVERMTGLKVVEVNVSVDDVYLPSDDSEQDTPVAGVMTDASPGAHSPAEHHDLAPDLGGVAVHDLRSGQTIRVAADGLVDGVDVDAVARAVQACAGVSGLYAGRFGEVGSYLPGRRISGVQVSDDAVTVQVRARWGVPATDLFAQIVGVTASLRHGRGLDLVVADVDDPLSADESAGPVAITASTVAIAVPPAIALPPTPPVAAPPFPALSPVVVDPPAPTAGALTDIESSTL